MLVLSRKRGERVVVGLNGEEVSIEIIKVKGNQVRLGIMAPTQVAVHREEVWNRIAAELTDQKRLRVAV